MKQPRHLLLGLVALATLGWSAPPPVEITVRTGDADVREGEAVGYEVTVHNRSDHAYPDAVISQMLPGGFRSDAPLSWPRPLPKGETTRLTVTARAGSREQMEQARMIVVAQPGDRPRADAFTTTVCVRESATGPILACNSAKGTLQPPAPDSHRGLLLGGTVAALLAALAAAAVVLRRRRAVG